MILPIWRPLLPLAVFAATGAALDRALALGLGGGVGKWARWAACGIVACFAAALHPLVLALLAALAAIARVVRGARIAGAAGAPPPTRPREGPPWWGIAAAVLTLVVVCRPATLTYWDSFVWLAKARIESDGGWGALRAAALDRSADVMPSGYPMLWPLAASWLSMGGHSMEALAAGAAAMTLVTLMLFLDAASEVAAFDPDPAGLKPRWAPAGLGLVAVTPLVLVHLRSAYADLPVGLLAATCTLRLARGLERPGDAARDLSVAAIAAAALVGMKDEGMAHVAALVGAAVIVRLAMGARLPLGPVMAMLTAAAIPFNGWRMLLLSHHVADVDHKPSAPDFEAAGAIRAHDLAPPRRHAELGRPVAGRVRVRGARARAGQDLPRHDAHRGVDVPRRRSPPHRSASLRSGSGAHLRLRGHARESAAPSDRAGGGRDADACARRRRRGVASGSPPVGASHRAVDFARPAGQHAHPLPGISDESAFREHAWALALPRKSGEPLAQLRVGTGRRRRMDRQDAKTAKTPRIEPEPE